jgi:lipoteichoic acid synthase
LLDLYWGSDQDYKSVSIYNKALKNKVGDVNFSFKLAKAYVRMNIVDDVANILNSILIENPENKEFIKFK